MGYSLLCIIMYLNLWALHFIFSAWGWFNPLTQNVPQNVSYDISTITHDIGVEKIKEDSSTEREKSPLQFELYLSQSNVRVDRRIFLMKMIKKSQIGNAFSDWKSTYCLMQIGNVWPKNHIFFIYFYL